MNIKSLKNIQLSFPFRGIENILDKNILKVIFFLKFLKITRFTVEDVEKFAQGS